MWESIEHMLLSPNATVILVFLAFVVIVGLVLSKTGLLNVHTENIQIGAADKERDIIRQQIEWIHLHCEAFEANMPKPDDYDAWRGKYIAERVYDECVNWITFNHITSSPAYIEIKQDNVVGLVRKYVRNDFFKTQEFDTLLREDVKQAVEKLIQIRKVYK